MSYYDSHGWLSLADTGRQASIDAPAHGNAPVVGEDWPNWDEKAWVMRPYAVPESIAPTTPTYGTKITTDAFYRRLTPSERRRMELASLDPGADGPARNLAADLRVGQRRLAGAAYFDLALLENITTVTTMMPLLDPPGSTRVAAILTSPVTDPTELPGSVRVLYNLPEIP